MKRLVLALSLVIATVIGVALPAQAQKGEMALGIQGGVATQNNGGYTDVFFQYNVGEHVRIAPEIGYVFRNKRWSAFEMSVDVQFPFRLAKGFGVYPLVGPTINSWTPRKGDSATRFGVDFGAGFDLYLTQNLKFDFQGKYSLMDDFGGGFFGIGIAYVF